MNIGVIPVAYDTAGGTAPYQPKPVGNLAEHMSTAIGAVMSTRAPAPRSRNLARTASLPTGLSCACCSAPCTWNYRASSQRDMKGTKE